MMSETGISDSSEQAAEHVALVALDAAFAVQDVDRAAQFVMAGDTAILIESDTPNRRSMPRTSASTALTIGPNTRHEEQHSRRDQQRNAVGIGDGDRLRQHFAEDDDQRRHDHGGVETRRARRSVDTSALVASAEAAMVTSWPPSNIALMSRLRVATSRATSGARRRRRSRARAGARARRL